MAKAELKRDLEKGDVVDFSVQLRGKERTGKEIRGKKKDDEPEEKTPWSELSSGEQLKSVMWVLARIVLLVACLYVFICSLGLLEDSFQLLGGRAAGQTFRNSDLLSNPVAGLMIGVLATVLVQSSSTSTSIIITMVGSEIIPIRSAIPIIMGANIGTSVTNTLVSLAQASDRGEFRRAFSGATVHDMFNWLNVLVLLPLEVAVHYLEWITGLIVDSIHLQTQDKSPDMLKAVTRPLTQLVVEVDKDVIKNTAKNGTVEGSVLKRWCDVIGEVVNVTHHNSLGHVTVNCREILAAYSPSSSSNSSDSDSSSPWLLNMCLQASRHPYTDLTNVSTELNFDTLDQVMQEKKLARCPSLFAQTELSDSAAGGILLVCSLVIIFLALYGLVKILHSVLHGSLAGVIKKFINSDLPGKAAYFTGYIFILVGCGMTMILQSSSVFTSTLTPMVGVGVVTVERMYPLTLGANIGTTLTGILAALSQEGNHLQNALHVALCHLFFNITGIVLFYPVPFLRFPIGMAKALGRTTSKHRWFAIAYLLLLFVLFPGAVFGLSLAGWVYMGAVGGPLLFLFLAILIINAIQRKRPGCLPPFLRTWDFLPHCCHSLKPIDNLISRLCRCGCCQKLQEADLGDNESLEGEDKDEDEDEVEEVRVKGGQLHEVTAKTSTEHRVPAVGNGRVKNHVHENEGFEMEEHRL
ncbi:sodium-dependent phosphate transport protein 2C-like [Babylonia areolata]|uniref:sodium-dependent phosphate transport protein 2C-like n=1 Tax=Babylonia areolata TaxID=304850 RepID=UPI003FD5964B